MAGHGCAALLAPGRRRRRLEEWFDAGVRRLHCIPWEASTGLRWAELLAALRVRGEAMPVKDNLIAATALANDLAVATLNRRDFELAGVPLTDPAGPPYRHHRHPGPRGRRGRKRRRDLS